MKKILFLCLASSALFLIFTHPALIAAGCARGLDLWYTSVLPSLLPFMILSGLLVHTGLFHILNRFYAHVLKKIFHISESGCYVVLTGFLCGFPMGAKVTADLVKSGHISSEEGRYLLGFCNNVSPAFFLNYFCAAGLGCAEPPWGLFLLFYSLPVLYGILSRPSFHFSSDQGKKEQAVLHRPDFPMLDACIMDSFTTVTRLGGYIILFTIIAQFLNLLRIPESAQIFLSALLEVSSGIDRICSAKGFSTVWKSVFACACAAFGGLCICAQTQSVLSESPLSVRDWLKGRLITLPAVLLLTYLYLSAAPVLRGYW